MHIEASEGIYITIHYHIMNTVYNNSLTHDVFLLSLPLLAAGGEREEGVSPPGIPQPQSPGGCAPLGRIATCHICHTRLSTLS